MTTLPPLTASEIEELKRLEAAATKGEKGWHLYIDDEDNAIAVSYQYRGPNGGACRSEVCKMPVPGSFNRQARAEINANAAFIAAARNALPRLLDEIDTLRRQLAEREAEVERLKVSAKSSAEENEYLHNKLCEAHLDPSK